MTDRDSRRAGPRGRGAGRRARSAVAAAATIVLATAGLALAAGPAGAQPHPSHRAQAGRQAHPGRQVHRAGQAHRAGRARAPRPQVKPAAGPAGYRRACPVASRPGQMACMALINTGVLLQPQAAVRPDAAPTGVGYGPADLQSAYKLPSGSAGGGQTVAIVDAYDDPNAAADLATYRAAWGLPACGTECFRKVNEHGQTSPLPAANQASGWATEESLDLDMVSAICPNCNIVLVEANSASTADLGTGVNAAVSLGAQYVSNSYGGPESASDPTLDGQYFKHAGVVVTASAGDNGYGVSYPAASPWVTAVGGTSLAKSTNTRGWTESVWGSSAGGSGSGSGCAKDSAKPAWQTDSGCTRRTDNDVAADANPNTGVAVYDSYDQGGWLEVGGTSASAPMIAAAYALAGPPAPGTFPASYIYAHTGNLFDVTSGSDGSCSPAYLCTAQAGYDGPAGWGTPNGVTAFTSGTGSGGGGNTVTVTNPGTQTSAVGSSVSLAISATDSASGQTLSYSATGLPAGLSINPGTGVISGTPTTAATSAVSVMAADGSGASGSASFSWTVNPAAGSCPAGQLLGNPGFETGSITPWAASPGVLTSTSAGVPAHSGRWLTWLDGYKSAHTDTVAQTVSIPASCKTASLSFWLEVVSNAARSQAADTFKVQVLDQSGAVLVTLGTFSNQDTGHGYVQHSYSLARYIGQQITIRYTGAETFGHRSVTSFYEDDNALTVS